MFCSFNNKVHLKIFSNTGRYYTDMKDSGIVNFLYIKTFISHLQKCVVKNYIYIIKYVHVNNHTHMHVNLSVDLVLTN